MNTVDPPGTNERKDTRGLPEGMDPHKLYEYRFKKLQEKPASVLEYFIYRYMPLSLVKSVAFAIDPTGPFKVSPGVITPENRTKYRQVASVLHKRTGQTSRHVSAFASGANYLGVGGCCSPFTYPTGYSSKSPYPIQDQPALPDTLVDTTGRTRLIGSKQGTLTMFKGFINSPSRMCRTRYANDSSFVIDYGPPPDNCTAIGGTTQYKDGGIDDTIGQTIGTGAVLSVITHSQLRQHEIDYNIGLMQSNAVSMIKGYSPFKREYTYFRNLVELRDVKRSIASLHTSLNDLRKLYVSLQRSPSIRKIVFDLKNTSKNIPGEYLSFHFGWKQIYKDIIDLLAAPEKFQKKTNFLISRSGKPTTFRSKRKFVSGESGVSGFEYERFGGIEVDPFTGPDGGSRISRESELRLVINSTFDFPPIAGVQFQNANFARRMGVVPRVTDLYNLVPWTWLVDWFSGMGNYIELIDEINHDPSLINWGMLTCVSQGKLTTDFHSISGSFYTRYANGVKTEDRLDILHNRHTSIYDYVCETRRDVSTILDVKTTSEPTSLTAYQKSILGALLAQRSGFTRKQAFRPRS